MSYRRYRYDTPFDAFEGPERRRVHANRRRDIPKRKASADFLEPLDRHHGRRRNQSDEEEEAADYVMHCRRRPFAYAPMAMVCLPPLGYYRDDRDESDYDPRDCDGRLQPSQRHTRNQRRAYNQRHHRSGHHSSSPCDEYDSKTLHHGIRSQRVRSLQAMARVQQNAAQVIQQEFRYYRNRTRNRRRQQDRRQAQADELLDRFMCEDMLQSIVSDSLLEVLRDDIAKRSIGHLSGDAALLSCAEDIYHALLGGLVSDVFQVVLNSMVREYMVTRLDLSRASQPSSQAVAQDILNECIMELAGEILPEALSELAQSYIGARRQDECFQSLLADELRDVAVDAAVEMTLSAMLVSLAPSFN